MFSEPGVPDHEWRRQNTLQSFIVRYDPDDLASVRLYRRDRAGQLRFERIASTYMVIHRAIQEQTPGEARFIRQEQQASQQDRIERVVAGRTAELEHGTAPEQQGLQSPQLKGLRKEVNDEIERRTRRYRQLAQIEPGQATKTVSLLTFDDLDHDNTIDPVRLAQSL